MTFLCTPVCLLALFVSNSARLCLSLWSVNEYAASVRQWIRYQKYDPYCSYLGFKHDFHRIEFVRECSYLRFNHHFHTFKTVRQWSNAGFDWTTNQWDVKPSKRIPKMHARHFLTWHRRSQKVDRVPMSTNSSHKIKKAKPTKANTKSK